MQQILYLYKKKCRKLPKKISKKFLIRIKKFPKKRPSPNIQFGVILYMSIFIIIPALIILDTYYRTYCIVYRNWY